LARVIRAIRQASLNRSVGIMTGGPLLVARPELAVLMGADATALDGPMAVRCAEHMCDWQRDNFQRVGADGHRS
jgi:hypothetical protein